MLVGVLLDCHVRQNCFQLGLNCCFPIFDNGELHIPFHLWLDFRLPSHLTIGCHFCQNCHIPMTQLLLILRQKEHYPLLYFFIQNSMPHTRTPDIEPINVAYLGAARRSYNVSKKTGVFSRFYRANLLLSYNCGGSWCYRGLKNHWMTIHCFHPVSGCSTLIKSHCSSPLLFLTVFKFLLPVF